MEIKDGKKAIYARTRQEWRNWLADNFDKESSIWLILYHKHSKVESVKIDEAVEEALCYGWIDSKAKNRDHESTYLTFSQRKAKSNWSKINKDRVEKLTLRGLMTEHGQKLIDIAKKNGMWDAANDVDNLTIPDEMQKLFDENPTALSNFNAFSKSSKRLILSWIYAAKRPETKQKRIEETIRLANENKKANH